MLEAIIIRVKKMPKLKLQKAVMFFVTSCMALMILAPLATRAQINVLPDETKENLENIGFTEKDPREITTNIINIALGFLGLIAVILILIGGFKWMTAGGNEEQVSEAKKWIYSGIIGLVIIFAAYAIATFVISQISGATS